MREPSSDAGRARRRAFVITAYAGLAAGAGACGNRGTAAAQPTDAAAAQPMPQTGGMRMGSHHLAPPATDGSAGLVLGHVDHGAGGLFPAATPDADVDAAAAASDAVLQALRGAAADGFSSTQGPPSANRGLRMGGGPMHMGGTQSSPVPRGSVRIPAATATGGLSGEAATVTARRNIGQARNCYSRALGAQPALTGALDLEVRVNPDGSVRTASVHRRALTVASPDLASCVLSAARRWLFPPPGGSGASAVITLEITTPG